MKLDEAKQILKQAGAELQESSYTFEKEMEKVRADIKYKLYMYICDKYNNKFNYRQSIDNQISIDKKIKIYNEIYNMIDELVKKSIDIIEEDQ